MRIIKKCFLSDTCFFFLKVWTLEDRGKSIQYILWRLKTNSHRLLMFPQDRAALNPTGQTPVVYIPSELLDLYWETLPNHLLGAGPNQDPDNWLSPVLNQVTEAATHLLQTLLESRAAPSPSNTRGLSLSHVTLLLLLFLKTLVIILDWPGTQIIAYINNCWLGNTAIHNLNFPLPHYILTASEN